MKENEDDNLMEELFNVDDYVDLDDADVDIILRADGDEDNDDG